VHVPFTASHPAAILPLRRLGLPMSALVIGSVVPDLTYYLGFLDHRPSREQTHSLGGVLTIDLALGFAAFVVWHALLTRPLLWAAPAALQARVGPQLRVGIRARLHNEASVVGVWVALVVGGLTHIVWDAFTHPGGWATGKAPWLATPVLGLPVQNWAHAGSSVLGIAAIAWALARWWQAAPARADVGPRTALHRLLGKALGVWVLLAVLEVAVGLLRAPSQAAREGVLGGSLVDFVSGLLVATVLGAASWHAVARWRPAWLRLPATSPSPAPDREDVRSA
jgi:hypothetical protein